VTLFILKVQITGSDEKKSTLTYNLQDINTGTPGGDFEAAIANSAIVTNALDAICLGEITHTWLNYTIDVSGSIPAAGDSTDVFQVAQIVTALNTALELKKTALVNIPCPDIAIFEGVVGTPRDLVDRNNANLQTFINALAANVTVSDGEIIQVATGINGMYSGRRVPRPRKLGNN